MVTPRSKSVLINSKRKETHIENYICHHKPYIPPTMAIKHIIAGCQQVVCRADTTEIASGSCIGIGEVAASTGYVLVHILTTCLARRRRYVDKFNGRTVDFLTTDS
jgi:hypothetical protein